MLELSFKKKDNRVIGCPFFSKTGENCPPKEDFCFRLPCKGGKSVRKERKTLGKKTVAQSFLTGFSRRFRQALPQSRPIMGDRI